MPQLAFARGVAAVGLLPALSLLIGASLGLNARSMRGHARGCCCQPACAPLCSGGGVRRLLRRRAIAFGFLMGGAALTVDARERALHSSIRQLLNEQFGGFLIDSIGPAGRHDPLLSRAVLVEDAASSRRLRVAPGRDRRRAACTAYGMPSRAASRSASTGRPQRIA